MWYDTGGVELANSCLRYSSSLVTYSEGQATCPTLGTGVHLLTWRQVCEHARSRHRCSSLRDGLLWSLARTAASYATVHFFWGVPMVAAYADRRRDVVGYRPAVNSLASQHEGAVLVGRGHSRQQQPSMGLVPGGWHPGGQPELWVRRLQRLGGWTA